MRGADDVKGFIPSDLTSTYEVLSVRGAAALLHTKHRKLLDELVAALRAFRFPEAYALKGGGNGSQITATFKEIFNKTGWVETRISADLLVKRFHGRNLTKPVEEFLVEGYVGGHKIDFVKDRVAVDFEWNSKDQTYDRDLYAARAFYECGVIDVFVIVTRSAKLNDMFAKLGISRKYGASTTWMGKLIPRLEGGRAGGCPVLVFGITPDIVLASDPSELAKAKSEPESPGEEDVDA